MNAERGMDFYSSGFYRPEGFCDGLSLPGYRGVSPVTREAFAYDFYPARGNFIAAPTHPSAAGSSIAGDSAAPLLIWVHGGAWRFGTNRGLREETVATPASLRLNRQTLMRRALQERGWAVASINYRYSHQALFPGALHELKQAVRYFRVHAERLGIDPARIAVAGGSAGGHLSMMATLTGGETRSELHEYYEGLASSRYPGATSRVVAAASFYGVSDLRTIFSDRPLAGYALAHPKDDGAEWRLLGCEYPVPTPEAWEGLVPGIGREQAVLNWERAHPLDFVTVRDPAGDREGMSGAPGIKPATKKSAPLIMVHGIADSCVPYQQSVRVYRALRSLQQPTDLVLVPGAEHGDSRCFSPDIIRRIINFLDAGVQIALPEKAA